MSKIVILRVFAVLLIATIVTMMCQTISDWEFYERRCFAPLQFFLMLFYSYSIILLIISLVASTTWFNKGETRQKVMSMFIFFVLFPAATYLLVRGFLWLYENNQYPHDSCPDTTSWIFVFILFINVITYLILGFFVLLERYRMAAARNISLASRDGGLGIHLIASQERIGDGLEQDEIDKIEKLNFSMSLSGRILGKQDECGICFDKFQKGSELLTLPKCGHLFHPDCVFKWLQQSVACPLCRTNIRRNLNKKRRNKASEGVF